MEFVQRKFEDDLGNNLLSDVSVCNKMNELTEKVIKDIAKKREDLILNRCKELNIDINIKEEQRRVFKRFATVRNGNEETILFNDGSIKGLRVITFVTKEIDFNPDNYTMGCNTSYY